ncbi:MAG: ATP-dependent DNA ligase [Candidatus Micrarchaeota archaeon]
MLFTDVANAFSKIESKSGRLEMTDILAELFKNAKKDEIRKLVYIVQGILAPPYLGIELGLGEKFAIAAIASASGYTKTEVEKNYKKSGDLGLTSASLLKEKKQLSLSAKDLDILYVYDSFYKIAGTAGLGSQELKIKHLVELLNNCNPADSIYIIRFVLGRLRLGVGDPTILDALSVCSVGDKSLREPLERAFNVCADLGYVAEVFFSYPEKIDKFKVTPFKPLMPALAERLSNPEEIIEKIGECAVEFKLDGFRMQCHKKDNEVRIYSRSLKDITNMLPEVVASIKDLNINEIIFEGEALAYNESEKRFHSFQETMHRRRKYGIDKAQKELPLYVFCFDIVYLDGQDLTFESYKKRRRILEETFPSGVLKLSEMRMINDSSNLEKMFKESIDKGLEGIMAKDLNSPYTAGKRKFAWIKLKKSYGKAVDTVDAVIVGYFLGKGSRAEFEFGGLLVAVYNEDTNRLETVAKIGSGYSEQEMKEFRKTLDKIKTKTPPANLDFADALVPDYWVEPKYIVEVAFDEITVSSNHTCGMDSKESKGTKGYALRFPRMQRLRDDKSVADITTTREVISMFERQRR